MSRAFAAIAGMAVIAVAQGLVASGSAAATQVSATDQAQAGGDGEIIVTGLRNPFRLSGKQLRSMIDAYRRSRPGMAPNAAFQFVVVPIGAGADLPGLQLSLVGKTVVSLPIDSVTRVATIPDALPAGDYELVTNRRRGTLRLSPFIASPGTSAQERRIGDLRLQCEVMWAGVKSEIPMLVRMAFATAGACNSRRIAFYFRSETPLDAAVLFSDGRESPVPIALDRTGFRAPIYNKKVSNEARVRLHYADS